MFRLASRTGIELAVLAALFLRCAAQVPDKSTNLDEGFTLSLPVNEVSLTFHVSDPQGAPIQNLSQEDVRLFDDGKPESRIVNFEAYHDLPLRAGILMDTSISMESGMRYNVDIATEYLERFFRRQTDRAFVMRFDVGKQGRAFRLFPGAQFVASDETAEILVAGARCGEYWKSNRLRKSLIR